MTQVPSARSEGGAADRSAETARVAPGAEFERFRLQYGREIVVVALVVLTAVVAIVVVAFEASTSAAAVLGAVTTLIGTLVGTFFGAQVASQGQEREAASRERAQELAIKAATLLDPARVREYGAYLWGDSYDFDGAGLRPPPPPASPAASVGEAETTEERGA